MNFRTDLALERAEMVKEDTKGVKKSERSTEKTKTTIIEITDSDGEKALGKPIGKYITVEMPPFSSEVDTEDERLFELVNCVKELLPPKGDVLVAGVGNADITADALGPFCASSIFSTRHISEELQRELGFGETLRRVSAVSTGVLGQTGLESSEYIKLISDGIKPSAVITVDALAARRVSRLGSTVQLSDTGISPGSGIGNGRKRIDRDYIGVPVIAIGVPTVVDAITFSNDIIGEGRADEKINEEYSGMTVTPKDIDIIVKNAAKLLALSINCALQPSLSADEVSGLM